MEIDNNANMTVESKGQNEVQQYKKVANGHRISVSTTEPLSPVDYLELRTVRGSHENFQPLVLQNSARISQ